MADQGLKLLKPNVIVKIDTSSVVDLKIDSKTIVGIVGSGEGADKDENLKGLKKFLTVSKAIEAFKEKKGSILESLEILDLNGVNCEILTSVYGTNKKKEAVEELLQSVRKYNLTPDIIIAPDIENETNILDTIKKICDKHRSIAIIALKSTKIDEAKTELLKIKNRRIYPFFYSDLKRTKVTINGETITEELVKVSPVAYVAAVMAKNDAHDNGYGISPAMCSIKGLSEGGTEHYPGSDDCESQLLIEGSVNSIVRTASGFSIWGSYTAVEKGKEAWRSLIRVRIIDKIASMLSKEFYHLIEKKSIAVITHMQMALGSFLNKLKGSNILTGFKIEWDKEKNTNESLAKGAIALKVDFGVVSVIRRITILLKHTNEYNQSIFTTALK